MKCSTLANRLLMACICIRRNEAVLSVVSVSRKHFLKSSTHTLQRWSLCSWIRGGASFSGDSNASQLLTVPPPPLPPLSSAERNSPATDIPIYETVEERVESWRSQQRQQAASLQDSPRDSQGRMKLLTSVSRGSRAMVFFLLMVRNIHLYEVADQSRKGFGRLICVIPLAVLFVANLIGIIASLTSPQHSHAAKKRLKAILNLDKLLETSLLVYYFLRLTVLPPRNAAIPREIYIANLFHSVFFLLQCQAITRLSWDESAAQPIHSYYQPSQLHPDGSTDSSQSLSQSSSSESPIYYPADRNGPPDYDGYDPERTWSPSQTLP